MGNPIRAAETIGGKMLAVALGTLAGMAIGALVGFLLFAAGEALGELLFDFGGFGDGPFVDMAPRSRLRGGFLVLGAAAGLPGAWWVMWRMARADVKGSGGDGRDTQQPDPR